MMRRIFFGKKIICRAKFGGIIHVSDIFGGYVVGYFENLAKLKVFG